MSRPGLVGALALLFLSGTTAAAELDAGGPAKPLPEPAKAVAEIFTAQNFQFCHEPGYPLTPSEKAWCDLGAGEKTQVCPALREACKNDALAKQIEREPFSFRLPDLGLPVRLLLWGLLGLMVAMLVFALVRHFLDHKSKDEVVRTQTPDSAGEDRKAAFARQVETDVQRLLERAHAEAAAGEFRAAMGDAYAALLRRLEGAGVVQVEPDKTNGDYLRQVIRERPAIARPMAEVVDAVEVAQFGDQTVTRESFNGVWMRVTGLLAERIGMVLVLVGLLMFGVACGQPRADWDYSPSGRAGVVDYLGKRGFKVHERLLSFAKIADSKADQLLLLPGAHLDEEEWKAVKAWILAGDHELVLAGGSRELPDWIGVRIVEKQASRPEPIVLSDAETKRWGALRVRVPEANYLESKPGSGTLLTRKQAPYAAERRLSRGQSAGEDAHHRVLVLADDFLFRNASLLVADNAAVLDQLLRDGGTSVEVAGDLTGMVSSNPVQSVQRGRLGPVLLELAAFLLVFFAYKGARFGRPIHSQRVLRREFAEHVRALGLHYARARGERLALGFIGAYASERLRERFGLHGDRSLSGLAEAVATRTGRPVGEVMRMLLEARDAGKGVPAEKDARDLETAAELCKLLEETGGTGGHNRIQSHI